LIASLVDSWFQRVSIFPLGLGNEGAVLVNRLVVASVTLLCSVGGAWAGDFFEGVSVDRLMNAAPAATWTGPYVGFTVGYGWADLEATNLFATVTGVGSGSLPLTGFTTSENSFNAGGTAGYNFYTSNMVLGVEADVSFGDHEYNSGTLSVTDVFVGGDTLTGDFNAGFKSFGTLRGRAGLLVTPSTLLYATGGLAVANAKAHGSFTYDDGTGPISGTFSDRDWTFGWTAGVGIEDKFAERVSLKLEYLYLSFPDATFEFGQPGVTVGFDGEASMHMVRTGLNIGF
jgi:outer membrane immunogenic protein